MTPDPIDTAPKTGELIRGVITAHAIEQVKAMWWSEEYDGWISGYHIARAGRGFEFMDGSKAIDGAPVYETPTHWVPAEQA